jgi:hypothetical protein
MEPAQHETDLCRTLPYYINFTIQRLQDAQEEPCIFQWSATTNGFSRACFVLLHRDADNSLEKIDISKPSLFTPDFGEESSVTLDGYNHHMMKLWEMKPGDIVNFQVSLSENYQKLLVPGEQYHLIWPGAEIDRWDWGTVEGHIWKELTAQSAGDRKLPKLIIPACDGIVFTAKEELEP